MNHPARRALLSAMLPDGADALLVSSLPNVRYLSGFTGSNGALILTADSGVFITDGRYADQSAREVPDLERIISGSGFARVAADACSALGIARLAFESSTMTHRTFSELSDAGLKLAPTIGVVERLRWAKDEEEMARIRGAQEVADRAFGEIQHILEEGVSEREVALELDTRMRRLGADSSAFETIVAFGESSAEPHHSPSDRALRPGDLVKLDFGSVLGGYHSDMTRTLAYGDPGPEMVRVYEVVLRAHLAALEAVCAGAAAGRVDSAARDIISDAGYADAFRHPTGHGVGLEIHEGPWIRAGGGDVLPVGGVVTVEPGVYLDGLGGVRIEDMVEVTEQGGRPIPSTPKELMIL